MSILLVYVAVAFVRIVNAWFLQTQFDPDEYWQTLEPAYCEAFGRPSSCAYTWEWTRRHKELHNNNNNNNWLARGLHGPLRSYVSVLPTYVFYLFIQRFQWDDKLFWVVVSKGPMLLHAALVAAPTDVCIWYMARFGNEGRSSLLFQSRIGWWALACCLTLWFQGYAMIRTYSNAMEALFLAVGLALVAPEFFCSAGCLQDQALAFSSRKRMILRSRIAFCLGGLSVAVRFTALAAWIPIGVLLALQQGGGGRRRFVRYLVTTCAAFGLVGIGLSLVLDRCFYGFWAIPFLGSFHFNVLLGHGTLYGTHPFHWYFTSGIPAISGLLLPFILLDAWQFCSDPSSRTRGQQNTWILIVVYTALHSYSPHKEFRFLLPIVPLLCLRAAHVLCRLRRRRRSSILMLSLCCLALPNLVALIYLGRFHQRAPLQVNESILQHVLQQEQQQHETATTASTATTRKNVYTIHYLMGCHATPLFSHLHHPSIQFDPWTLDCSPSCRSRQQDDDDGDMCESEAFQQDPVGFIESHYSIFQPTRNLHTNSTTTTCDLDAPGECAAERHHNNHHQCREVPDFVAIMSKEAALVRHHLQSMSLTQVGRFLQGIHGIRIGSWLQLGDDDFDNNNNNSNNDAYRQVSFGWGVELSLEEMLLFASSSTAEPAS